MLRWILIGGDINVSLQRLLDSFCFASCSWFRQVMLLVLRNALIIDCCVSKSSLTTNVWVFRLYKNEFFYRNSRDRHRVMTFPVLLAIPAAHTWICGSAPCASASVFLLIFILGCNKWWLKCLGPYHPHWRSELTPRILALTWPNTGCCTQSGTAMRVLSLSRSHSYCCSLSSSSFLFRLSNKMKANLKNISILTNVNLKI